MTENLKRIRRTIKAQLTRQANFLEKSNLDSLTPQLICELKERLKKIEPLLDNFDKVQTELEAVIPPTATDDQGQDASNKEEAEYNEIEREAFEERYFQLTGVINALINEFESNNQVPTAPPLPVSDYSSPTVSQQQIKLPTIELPNFNGRYDEWIEFRDCFKALINDNNTLTNIQKFYYLRSCLKHEAQQIIESLQVSASNYQIAWQLLNERYEQKALVIHSHVKAIFDYPPVIHESHAELRKLFDTITKHLRALKSLGQPTDTWDTLVIHIYTSKMDAKTRREWELFTKQGDVPNIIDINAFFKQRCEILEKLSISKGPDKYAKSNASRPKQQSFATTSKESMKNPTKYICYYCKKEHSIFQCEAFLQFPIKKRIEKVRELNLCYNCLRPNHSVKNCTSSNCKHCGKRHNSFLHLEENLTRTTAVPSDNTTPLQTNLSTQEAPSNEVVLHSNSDHNHIWVSQVLLSTALVLIKDSCGNVHHCRALLDSGSQNNFITQSFSKQLKLKQTSINSSVIGIGQASQAINASVELTIISTDQNFKASIKCMVMEKITNNLPSMSFHKDLTNIPKGIQLADPQYYHASPIDLLIGSTLFWKLLCAKQIQLKNTQLTIQQTRLGWIVAGNLTNNSPISTSLSCCVSATKQPEWELHASLEKFWEIDTIPKGRAPKSIDEQYCEDHFTQNVSRLASGKFVVQIPLRKNVVNLGESRGLAKSRFLSLERKLIKNPDLQSQYVTFMQEYEELGHMSKLTNEATSTLSYYIPHHAIVREGSITTKLRVVFDASMKTDTGPSLNDVQHVGPTIQDDLLAILLRFRTYSWVMTSDISKMYRMVYIDPQQRSFQRIFWRTQPNEPLECYELNTVTYGTASAPFLAIRCLFQLAIDHESRYPETCEMIKRDFYVDDLITGSDSKQELVKRQHEINTILLQGGFELRKWLSNDLQLLNKFEVKEQLEASVLKFGENEINKTLGVLWNASSDLILYSSSMSTNKVISKRTILSAVSQVFDPLGLLGPIIITAKLLMQELWMARLTWDDPLPRNLQDSWTIFKDELTQLNKIQFPRLVVLPEADVIELHIFGDASERAYGACAYIRSIAKNQCATHLFVAKSRVAPIKPVTLPRLELCAALLAAQLLETIINSIRIQFEKVYLWSDSTITLCWIAGEANRWKTFVSNRVSEIQSLTKNATWKYIPSKENPADLLSRGTTVQDLLESKLWFHGAPRLSDPSFDLCTENTTQTNRLKEPDPMPEQRRIKTISLVATTNTVELFDRYSSVRKLIRVFCYMIRFISSTRPTINTSIKPSTNQLCAAELQDSLNTLLKFAQRDSFSTEYSLLSANKPIARNSKLLTLDPFIDDNGLIRVGGRLQDANIEYDKKHPVILDPNHRLTRMLLTQEHERLMHCGPTTLLATFREKFWPISGRRVARSIVRSCVRCFKVKPPVPPHAIMGNLPSVRINQSVPFYNTGCDFAGPFLLKDRTTRRARGAKLIKGYLCLFICLSTKAIHLEVVTELTADAFIATLRRFTSRRGKPKNIYSDNGTNFKGADNQIKELYSFLNAERKHVDTTLAEDNIVWHFIPARAPNFGGIWEANIKRVKYHLKRVVGDAHLTYEDFTTVLVQIEAILNSSPICHLTSFPDQLTPLTPAHFLVGKQLVALPDRDFTQTNESYLKRYERLQSIVQHFWRRWHREYLGELQRRNKWNEKVPNSLKDGMLVLLEEDNTSPLQWHMGRIVKLHPGKDDILRVVSVLVNNKVIQRPVSKVRVFPFEMKDA